MYICLQVNAVKYGTNVLTELLGFAIMDIILFRFRCGFGSQYLNGNFWFLLVTSMPKFDREIQDVA